MIGLIKSSFYNETDTKKKLADFILNCNKFSMGNECATFEKAFAKKQQRKYAVFVNSGSSANLILIQSLINLKILKKGGTVGVSALTWATNVMPLTQLGLHPYILDCSLDTLNLSPEILMKNISQLNGLFLTNTLGFSDDIDAIRKICDDKNIVFIEDNCESLGSKTSGRLLGNFGVASTFSTFVGHHLSTIEGGVVCTDDPDLYDMLLMVRSHGWLRNLTEDRKKITRQRYNVPEDTFYDKYTFYEPAYNVRPTEVTSYIGNIQIGYWDEIVERREQNWKEVSQVIDNNPDLHNISTSKMDKISNFAIPVITKSKDLFMKYKQVFENNEIEIRPIIAGNIALQPFLREYLAGQPDCPTAQYVHENGFYFGNNPELTSDEIDLFKKILTYE